MLIKNVINTKETQLYGFSVEEIITLLIKEGKIPSPQNNQKTSTALEYDTKKRMLYVHRDTENISTIDLSLEQQVFLTTPLNDLFEKEIISHKVFRELTKKKMSLSTIFEASKELVRNTFGISSKVFNEIESLFQEKNIPWY